MEEIDLFGLGGKEGIIVSVSELNLLVRQALRSSFPDTIWVEGEASRVKVHSSGHMYFVLKDESASVSAVMFRSAREGMKFELEHGMHIICRARVDIYEREGRYQIYVEEIVPKGVGALELAFRQLKEKLEKEGLFDESRKQELPFLPRVVGVITSPTGAAVRDIINVLKRRFDGVGILIYPVKVQGEGAAEEIAKAIMIFNEFFRNEVDVLIVGRGGGSIEDLWAFNEEIVARAISNSYIPVISAVGHEIDVTISDLVADRRAPTPSAGAEMAVPDKREIVRRIENLGHRLYRRLSHQWESLIYRLESIRRSRAFFEPQYRINEYMQVLDSLIERANNSISRCEEKTRLHLKSLAGKLEVLSPLKTLLRGYSIVRRRRDNRLISSVSLAKPGEDIAVRFSDGEVDARVIGMGRGKSNKKKVVYEAREQGSLF